MWWSVFEFSINLFQDMIIVQTITGYLGKKYNGWKGRLLAVTAILVLVTELTYINSIIKFEGIAIVIPILIIFLYAITALQGSWKKKLFFSIMVMVMITGVTAVVMNIIGSIFGKTYMQLVVQQNPLRFITVIIIQVIIFFISRVLLLKKNENDINMSWKLWTAIIVLPCMSVIILVLVKNLSLNVLPEFREDSVKTAAVIATGIFIIDLLTYYIYIRLEKDAAEKMEYEILKQRYLMQESNINDLNKLYRDLQKTKHDMKHHTNLLKMLLERKELDEAVQYLEKYTDTLYTNNKNNVYCRNVMINYIINAKAQNMEEKKIKFYCDIYGGIEGVSDVDFNIILGNLLDNAIEACERLKDKKKEIFLSMYKKAGYLIVSVKNTVEKKPEDLIQQRTSKADKQDHGFGVRSVSDVTKKYNGHFNIKYEDEMVEIICVLEPKAKQVRI